MRKSLIALWFGAVLFAPPVAAQSSSLDLATTFGSLFLVIALILLMSWLLKRLRLPALGQHDDLAIIRQLAVGTKERIMIIQAGDQQLVIGVTAHSIQLITELNTPLNQEVKTASFATLLSQRIKKNES